MTPLKNEDFWCILSTFNYVYWSVPPLKIMALVWTPPKFRGLPPPPMDVFDTFPNYIITEIHYVFEVLTLGLIWKLYLFSIIHVLINVSREERQNIYTLQRHFISDKNIREVPTLFNSG